MAPGFMKGSMAVNQSISSSFDPAKLNCISCDKEHPIIGNMSVVVVLSDQNFVSTLTGVSNDCINHQNRKCDTVRIT
jgi:hypothetical protein